MPTRVLLLDRPAIVRGARFPAAPEDPFHLRRNRPAPRVGPSAAGPDHFEPDAEVRIRPRCRDPSLSSSSAAQTAASTRFVPRRPRRDQHAESRGKPETGHGPSLVGHPVIADQPEHRQDLRRLAPGGGGGRVEPRQLLRRPRPPEGAFEDEPREIGSQDLGIRPRREGLRFAPEPHAEARAQSARAAASLVRAGGAHPLGHQAVETRARVKPGDPRPAAVRDGPDAGHREARFRNGGGKDHAPPGERPWAERPSAGRITLCWSSRRMVPCSGRTSARPASTPPSRAAARRISPRPEGTQGCRRRSHRRAAPRRRQSLLPTCSPGRRPVAGGHGMQCARAVERGAGSPARHEEGRQPARCPALPT